jgi:hypothetical protein
MSRNAIILFKIFLVMLVITKIGSAVLLLDLGRFFSFLILYRVGRTPWTGDQACLKAANYTQNNTNT